ncbi:MAG: hypothetical protein DRJ30_07625 [Candidatus Methanomethylicota archaeon]|mgnify:CR=1 FL=1|nr:MAG: hypothetical protein DRJ30_07625 [Candidatus Verstraetearchaeota archaeon]
MVRFCSICGKLESEGESLIENLCKDCYRRLHPLISFPGKLSIDICSRCGSYRLSGKWIKPSSTNSIFEASAKLVEKHVKLNGTGSFKVSPLGRLGKRRVAVEIIASGTVHPEIPEYVERMVVEVSYNLVVCPACRKFFSGSFDATVQVRGKREILGEVESSIFKLLDELMRRESGDKFSFSYEVERVPGGFDFKFGNYRLARLFSSKLREIFGAYLKESFKVVGVNRSGGRRISKLTVSVRLPSFRRNDILLFKDRILRFDGYSKNSFLCFDLSNWSPFTLNYRDFWSGAVSLLVKSEDLKIGVILSVYEDVIELMDISSYSIIHVSKPKFFNLKGGVKVKYFSFEDKVYIVDLA